MGPPTESDIANAQLIADRLRSVGLRVFVNVTGKTLGEQIKDADRRRIPYFTAAGEDERQSQILRIKRLSTSEERPLSVSDVAAYVRSA